MCVYERIRIYLLSRAFISMNKETVPEVARCLASFPGLSREAEGKAWGLLCAHAQQLPEKVVIGYCSKLSVTLVSILSV